MNLNNVATVLDGSPLIEEWQIEIRKKNDDPMEVDEFVLRAALKSGADQKETIDRIKRELTAACEICPNEILIGSLPEILDRVKMETSLKEVRFLDSRPK